MTTGYLAIPGELVLVGKEPDGDSVRFQPADPALLGRLEHGDRVRLSGDGTVQLRFDGVDAPELHYQGRAQPRGDTARDALLAHLGFTGLAYAGTQVVAATPTTLSAVVLARLVEVNGRPVALLLPPRPDLAGGDRVALTPELVEASANLWLVRTGEAYPLTYTSTDPPTREQFRAEAALARASATGLWAVDRTPQFPVGSQDDLGPGGALVFPKLFRRATDHLRAGTALTLPQWLAAHPDTEDDLVQVAGADPVPLHTLLTQEGTVVRLRPDLLDLVFVER